MGDGTFPALDLPPAGPDAGDTIWRLKQRVAELEHQRDHWRALLETAAGWLSIAPQASLEWAASLGGEMLAAVDEMAPDPLPCQQRVADLEAEVERLRRLLRDCNCGMG